MKKCYKCKENKSLIEFSKNKSTKDGLCGYCRKCNYLKNIKWVGTNRNKINRAIANWKKNNIDKVKRVNIEYRNSNVEKIKISHAKWKKENHSKENALTAKYRAQKLKATPSWLTKIQFKEIEQFYTEAKELSWLSEDGLTVDHIVPLQGKIVSGLHVPWNLQILPKSFNSSKGNRFYGDGMK